MHIFGLKKTTILHAALLFVMALSSLEARAESDIAISPAVRPKEPARYRMAVLTTSGVGIASQRILTLDARGLPAKGAPHRAWHMIPEGMDMGKYLPLTRPEKFLGEREGGAEYEPDGWTMKIYWGSAREVPGGQPVAISSGGNGRSQLYDAHGGETSLSLRREPPRGWGWGQWSNEDGQVRISSESSLKGNHFVHGNYLPHIKFAVSQHDFLAPLKVQTGDGNLNASIPVRWNAIPGAVGYFVYAEAENEAKKEYVIWTSSRRATYGIRSYEHSAAVRKLADAGVVLKPDVQACDIPAGIFAGCQNTTIAVYAWGNDYWASYPPKPQNPPKGWRPDWTVSGLFFARWMGMPGIRTPGGVP